MEEIIPSKDLRAYLSEHDYQLTDFEKAVIIYNLPWCLEDKYRALENIQADTGDEKLRKQIEQRMLYERKMIDEIKSSMKNYFYILRNYNEEDMEWEDDIYCAAYKTAEKLAKQHSGRSSIIKVKLLGEQDVIDADDFQPAIARISLDKNGKIMSYESDEDNQNEFVKEKQFWYAYISLPHPFRRGDIVRKIKTDEIGIVRNFATTEDWKKYDENVKLRAQQFHGDYSDVCVIVEMMNENFEFSHEHINPLYLEYAHLEGNDSKSEVLKSASRLVRGEGSIEEFQWLCEKES